MVAVQSKHYQYLKHLFMTAIKAVSAKRVLPAFLPVPPKGRTIIIAAGKGASVMASVMAKNWSSPFEGLIVTRYGHHISNDPDLQGFEVIEASHPVPDENGVMGGARALEMVSGLSKDDLVLVLLSGGGSSLLPAPADGVSLSDKIALTRALLASGATIDEINCVRKHLSNIKGGRLAKAAAPARIITLAVADVVGNAPDLIASGPTVENLSTLQDALDVIQKYRLDIPPSISAALHDPKNETPKLNGPEYALNKFHIVASAGDALSAVEKLAKFEGYEVVNLGDLIEGEARDVASLHANLVQNIVKKGRPTLILSGGEVTVKLSDKSGVGGPNTEYMLALAIALNGMDGVYALACDTDGKDGEGDNAGAIIGPNTLEVARQKNICAETSLQNNDSYNFFKTVDGLVVTGPTGTNINDFRVILVTGQP